MSRTTNTTVTKEEVKPALVPKLRFPEFRDAGEWDAKSLNQITTAIFDGTHQTPTYTEDGVPFFSVENIVSGKLNKFISKEDHLAATSKHKPEKGDVLITRIGNIGFSTVVDWDYEFSIYVTLAVVKRDDRFNSHYLHSFVQSGLYQTEIRSKSLLNAVPCKINMDELRKTKVLLPTPEEQQKIADCLSSLDTLITTQSQKLDALRDYKKGLMQQLFPAEGEAVPRLRFAEFQNAGEWDVRELSDFITERNQYPKEKVPLFSLTIEDGVTPKTERYERSFLVNNEADAYKLVLPNDFAFNPMNLRFGSIGRHSGTEKVAVSKYYNIFSCDSSVDSRFCEIYFRSDGMVVFYDDRAIGSLIEKRRVHFAAFLKFNIRFPRLPEQQKIADCLSSLDTLIAAQTQKLKALKTHKNGLMQQLFPTMDSE